VNAKPELTNEQKREVVRHLLNAAGTMIEYWDEKETGIAVQDARACVAKWLARLPGTDWDVRLDQR
jgi:preprotein translocase subunit Sec61beta